MSRPSTSVDSLSSSNRSPTPPYPSKGVADGFKACQQFVPQCDACFRSNRVCCKATQGKAKGLRSLKCKHCRAGRVACKWTQEGVSGPGVKRGPVVWCHRDKGIVGYKAPKDETPTAAGSSTVPCECFFFVNFVRVSEMKVLTLSCFRRHS